MIQLLSNEYTIYHTRFFSADWGALAVIFIILGLPIYFIWRWIFRKIIPRKRKLMLIRLTTTITTPVFYIGIASMFFYCLNYYPKHQFERKFWIENKEKRYEISDDIIYSKILIGKTKTEVIKYLGDEGNTENLKFNDFHYEMGFRPQLASIDPAVLDIEFKDDKVVSVSQHH